MQLKYSTLKMATYGTSAFWYSAPSATGPKLGTCNYCSRLLTVVTFKHDFFSAQSIGYLAVHKDCERGGMNVELAKLCPVCVMDLCKEKK